MKIISFRLSALILALIAALPKPAARAAEPRFNLNALETDSPVALPEDISTVLQNTDGLIPGDYNVDIWFNTRRVITQTLHFIRNEKGEMKPEITTKDLVEWGVNEAVLNGTSQSEDTFCTSEWQKYIEGYRAEYDPRSNRLNISVPQISVRRSAAGEVNESLWDDGIPALLLSYDMQGNESRNDGDSSDNYYGNFQSGLNIGGWRLRNSSTFTRDSSGKNHWDSYGTKIFHDIRSIDGRFEAGNTWTRSSLFDSIRFDGAQIYSDESMLPYSQRGFAPVVRGIADTNATVTVRQHGSVIYQTVVSPGAFVIDDINPNSLSGDLEVTVREEDGRERKFIQPFSGVPGMVREGQFKYFLTAGKRDAGGTGGKEPTFSEMAVKYGILNGLTMYGGFQVAEDYDAVALGLGFGLGVLGAVSVDAIRSHARFDDGDNATGQSYSVNYSKSFVETGSTLTLASYRYSTENYYSLDDAADRDIMSKNGHRWHSRNKTQATYTQAINKGRWGALSLSGYRETYWDSDDVDSNMSIGYSNNIGAVSYSLDYSQDQSGDYDKDKRFSLYLSVPFDRLLPGSTVSYTMTRDNHHNQSQRATLSGTALEHNNLSYSLSGTTEKQGDGTFSGNTRWQGSSGEISASYSHSERYEQLHYGARGGVLVHSGGVTFSRNMGTAENGIILVDANGAGDIAVSNTQGVHTDSRGYAVRTYAAGYNHNRVSLDGKTLGADMDINQSITDVVPTGGAVVKAKFDVAKGYRALFLLDYHGENVPFGAQAGIDGAHTMTFVGDNGELYLSGLKPNGIINVIWPGHQCKASYSLDEKDAFYVSAGLFNMRLQCQ